MWNSSLATRHSSGSDSYLSMSPISFSSLSSSLVSGVIFGPACRTAIASSSARIE